MAPTRLHALYRRPMPGPWPGRRIGGYAWVTSVALCTAGASTLIRHVDQWPGLVAGSGMMAAGVVAIRVLSRPAP